MLFFFSFHYYYSFKKLFSGEVGLVSLVICHQMASSFKDLLLDWLIQKNDDVMILIYDQQEEYYANLPIINGIRKH